jgi:cytochrome c oxidase subunit 2
MFAQVPLFPPQASTVAPRVDALFLSILAIDTVMAVLVSVLVFYFALRYRRRGEDDRTARILGVHSLEWFWTITPLFFFLAMFVWGASIFNSVARPPADALEVFVVGKQWMWKIQHSGGQREINALHVPVNKPVKLTCISEDVIHDVGLPDFRVKIDVIPGRYTATWFQATQVGSYHLYCDQYCGTSHSNMVGEVIVMSGEEYAAWLARHAEGSLALEGRKLFLKLQCITCHSGDARARAPNLEGLYNQPVHLNDGRTVIADRDYLTESILFPRKKIVQGWEPIMPTFKGQLADPESNLSEQDALLRLIAYIQSLGRDQAIRRNEIPRRTDEFPPPLGAPQEPQESKKGKP